MQIGQTVLACNTGMDGTGSTIIIGGDLEPASGGVAHSSTPAGGSGYDGLSAIATFVYIDNKVVQSSGVAFANTGYGNSGGRCLQLRNVWINGTTQWTQYGGNSPRTATGPWIEVVEYVATDQRTAAIHQFNGNGGAFTLPSWNVIAGVSNQTPEPIVTVNSNAGVPPSNLYSRHAPQIDGVDTAPILDVRNFGAVSYTDTGGSKHSITTQTGYNAFLNATSAAPDSLTAINNALSTAAAAAVPTNVWLPRRVLDDQGHKRRRLGCH